MKINKNALISVSILLVLCISSLNSSGLSIDGATLVRSPMTMFPTIYQDRSNDVIYIPENITPSDASYHPSKEKFTIEWWYFEGIFDNGYNAVVNIILWSRNNMGLCITHLNIFNSDDPTIFFSNRVVRSLSQFEGTKTYPDISISGNKIVDFDQELYERTGVWNYNVSVELDGHMVNLNFIGRAPGWQGNTFDGFYGPVLPMADVTGEIVFNDELIMVQGLGYHEHAHGISFPMKESGWYWGKIVSDTMSFFWGKMMDSIIREQGRAGVFCMENHSFINIAPDMIEMSFFDYQFHKKRFIPTTFVFNVSDTANDISINVTITTVEVYHLPFSIINYWRYLICVHGEIIHNGVREELDNKTQIMELMRFR
ncbi:MAG: hypothetical protein QCH96_04805 [Candidatus Thermoplasmatota archaeon]|nr:hypothetical protein [Candidatus Thermoplasmatota archaeon]